MIIPTSVTDSITAAGIDVSNDWFSATAPVWNADYSAVLTQPISIAATPLADMRFLGVTTATITIRISSAPLSLVSWSGIATLVADDTTGGGSPIYPVHNSFTGRDVADTHPLASITGLVDALDGKAAALHASTHYAGGSDPIAGQSLAGLQTTDSPTFNRLVLTENGDGVSGANVCALVLDSNEPVFAFKNDAGASQNKYWNIGVNAGDWGPSFYHINDAKTLKTPVWRTRFNTTTGRIEFTLGFSGLADTIVSGTFKIGSLAGTLIGTAGNVSALSGTDLVLANGTTIPQSTFGTADLAGAVSQVAHFDGSSSAVGDAGFTVSQSGGVTRGLTIGAPGATAPAILNLSANATYSSEIWFVNDAALRWNIRTNSDASFLFIESFTALSASIDYPIQIQNSAGGPITIGGATARPIIMYPGSALYSGYTDQVVGDRKTGWAAASGTATRTTFATGSVTTAQLAERVKALLDDLIAHGLIGA